MPGAKYKSIHAPGSYEKIKQKLLDEGMSEQEAKTRAAKISNAQANEKSKKK